MKGFRGQITALVILVLCFAQLLSLWLFIDERSLAVQTALGIETAGRAANVARLIEEAPVSLHKDIVAAANSPLVQFDLAETPAVIDTSHDHTGSIEARIRALLGDSFTRDIRVEVHEIEADVLPLPNLSPEMAEIHTEMMEGHLAAIEMELSIALSGGQWLNVGTRFERPPIQWTRNSTLSFMITAAVMLLAVFWFFLSRLTRPLQNLAEAADRIGRGDEDQSINLDGPKEVQELTSSFNRMQKRLARFVGNRTQMLSALAHDLKSPLTALRVHAELVDDQETKRGLVTSLNEMEQMVDATLEYGTSVGASEVLQSVRLENFLQELQLDAFPTVKFLPGPSVQLRIKQQAMKRALRNLIENALRYGERPKVSWEVSKNQVMIIVDDEGPGIPDEEIERVFEPFARLEASRSLDTGGHGLGLAIARSIALEHGGSLTLSNRSQGGFRASIVLPR